MNWIKRSIIKAKLRRREQLRKKAELLLRPEETRFVSLFSNGDVVLQSSFIPEDFSIRGKKINTGRKVWQKVN